MPSSLSRCLGRPSLKTLPLKALTGLVGGEARLFGEEESEVINEDDRNQNKSGIFRRSSHQGITTPPQGAILLSPCSPWARGKAGPWADQQTRAVGPPRVVVASPVGRFRYRRPTMEDKAASSAWRKAQPFVNGCVAASLALMAVQPADGKERSPPSLSSRCGEW